MAKLLFLSSLNLLLPLYWFPGAAITEYHRLLMLSTEMYCFMVLEDRKPKSKCGQGTLLMALAKNLFHAFLLASGVIPWLKLHNSNLYLHSHMTSPFYVSLSSHSLLLRTLVILN